LARYIGSPLLVLGGLALLFGAVLEISVGSRQWVLLAAVGTALVIVWLNQWLYFANVMLYLRGGSLGLRGRLGREREVPLGEVRSLLILNVHTVAGTDIQVLMALGDGHRCLWSAGNVSFFNRAEIHDLAAAIGADLTGPNSTVLTEDELSESYPGSLPAGSQLLAWPVRHPIALGVVIFVVIFAIAAIQLVSSLPR
jgi:hypothetical protein